MHLLKLTGDGDTLSSDRHADFWLVQDLASDWVKFWRLPHCSACKGSWLIPEASISYSHLTLSVIVAGASLFSSYSLTLLSHLLKVHQICIILTPVTCLIYEILGGRASQHISLLRNKMGHLLVWSHWATGREANINLTPIHRAGFSTLSTAFAVTSTLNTVLVQAVFTKSSVIKRCLFERIWNYTTVHLLLARSFRLRSVIAHCCKALL